MHSHIHPHPPTQILGQQSLRSTSYPPIPWMFSNEQISLVDTRSRKIVLPPNCPSFCTTKAGIYEDTSSFWRMSSKLQVFLMLPVLFMGTIPTIYTPLSKLVHGIVLLIGRVVCERFRRLKKYVTVLGLSKIS